MNGSHCNTRGITGSTDFSSNASDNLKSIVQSLIQCQ